jgi:hypothetical protein
MLEPYEGKLSRTVLRGERGGNAPDLPDRKKEEVMPITYDVSNAGHVIKATAEGKVTSEEFIEFEVAHATMVGFVLRSLNYFLSR